MEGQTEEGFVKRVLAEYLKKHSVYIAPVLLKTSKTGKGGIRSFGQIERDIRKMLNDPSVHFITTMLDYADLPEDFPGKKHCKQTELYSRVIYLEEKFYLVFEEARFIPYLQLQEFEALLLSNPDCFGEVFGDKRITGKLKDALNRYENPEYIEKPSGLINDIIGNYRKVLHGIKVAECIGVERMLERCPHFRDWINRLTKKPQEV